MLIIYDTLVLGLELPATWSTRINRKIEQYYLVQEYGFRVERERRNPSASRSRRTASATSSRP